MHVYHDKLVFKAKKMPVWRRQRLTGTGKSACPAASSKIKSIQTVLVGSHFFLVFLAPFLIDREVQIIILTAVSKEEMRP